MRVRSKQEIKDVRYVVEYRSARLGKRTRSGFAEEATARSYYDEKASEGKTPKLFRESFIVETEVLA